MQGRFSYNIGYNPNLGRKYFAFGSQSHKDKKGRKEQETENKQETLFPGGGALNFLLVDACHTGFKM